MLGLAPLTIKTNFMTRKKRIPVVDIFAGPGGLAEGFARFPYNKKASPSFDIRLSIEKDDRAHQTLRLRSFRRQFVGRKVPIDYYSLLQEISRPLNERLLELYDAYPNEFQAANSEAICAELGNPDYKQTIDRSLSKAVGNEKNWVLVGGPPCQAYSLVGRSRNKGNEDYNPSKDNRQFLYREYLKIISDHLPSVFVMENVKGLLSATVRNKKIFEQIIEDLKNPRQAISSSKRKKPGVKPTYRLYSALQPEVYDGNTLSDFVIKMEDYGIPQKRHRLIILGIRDDLGIDELPQTLKKSSELVTVSKALAGLPRLRSGLSKSKDLESNWTKEVRLATRSNWYKALKENSDQKKIRREIKTATTAVGDFEHDRGADWLCASDTTNYLPRWYRDNQIDGVFNHQSRGHIAEDLHRYLFAACFAKAKGVSPVLKDFPEELWPNHKNVKAALKGSLFADRFRVQTNDRPSTTITCHISKDGHYYIHPDPSQCRSLTVREAARLQTFPDNYFFCGPRTSQYIQVGNAVPPLLAHQIADVVVGILKQAGVQ